MHSPWTVSDDYNRLRHASLGDVTAGAAAAASSSVLTEQQTTAAASTSCSSPARGSLGLFIERSTSAPPSSSSKDPVARKRSPYDGDSLVGSDLLGRINATQLSNSSTPLASNPSNGNLASNPSNGNQAAMNDFGASAAAFLANIDNSGRATAPTASSSSTSSPFVLAPPTAATTAASTSSLVDNHLGLTISRPLSASGTGSTLSSKVGRNNDSLFGGNSSSGIGLVRSQSAAPSVSTGIAPPPGLGGTSSSSKAPAPGLASVGRRPQSAGVLGAHQQTNALKPSALKPSAKTLMDLIQEDFPGENATSPPADAGSAMDRRSASTTDGRSASPDKRDYANSCSSTGYSGSAANNLVTPAVLQQQQQQQQQPMYIQQQQQQQQLMPQQGEYLRGNVAPTSVNFAPHQYPVQQQQQQQQQQLAQLQLQQQHQLTSHQHQLTPPPPQQQQQQQHTPQQQQQLTPPQQQQQLTPQQQQQLSQQVFPEDPYERASRQGLVLGPGQQHPPHQQPPQTQQVMTAAGPRYMTVPGDMVANQQAGANQQPGAFSNQQQGAFPCEDPRRVMYAPVASQQQVMHQTQHGGHMVSTQAPSPPQQQTLQLDPQQQLYYHTSSGQQRVEIPAGHTAHATLQAQVLPSGQQVYVQTSPSAAAPYGYTIQYHQQPQIIHHPSMGSPSSARTEQQQQPQQQYISVIPVQGSGGAPQQVTYWTQDVAAAAGQPMASVAIVGPGGAPIAMTTQMGNHVAGGAVTTSSNVDSIQASGAYGARPVSGREKGGRSRRGAGGNNRRNSGNEQKHRGATDCATSSPLLEEFRSIKNRDWSMHQIEGHVVEFCQDQNGSRFIQQRLELGDVAEHHIVMKEVLPSIRCLRNDVFGNYVVQKLLDFGTPRMKEEICETLRGEMLQLSLQMYGCRVVQKALEALDENDLPRLLTEFHHNVHSCIHDQNGNHVIQKCIEVLSTRAKKADAAGDHIRALFLNEQIDFIVDGVLVDAATLACHPYGCRVLQRMLEHCEQSRKIRLLDDVRKCHRKLLDDQYGNYVIQHVLQFGRHSDRESVLEIVLDSGLLSLSRQKFASNVVEKLLKYGSGDLTRAVVREMLKMAHDSSAQAASLPPGEAGASVVLLMVRDAYANYVVQTTLDVVPESDEKRLLLEELNSHCEELKNYTFAKHIVSKLSALNTGGA